MNENSYPHLDAASVKLLEENISLRIKILENYVVQEEKRYNVAKMREVYMDIMEKIKEADPETHRLILAHLHGMTPLPRTGLFQRIKDRVTSFFNR